MTPPGLGTLRVEEQASEYYAAIDAAAATLKKALGAVARTDQGQRAAVTLSKSRRDLRGVGADHPLLGTACVHANPVPWRPARTDRVSRHRPSRLYIFDFWLELTLLAVLACLLIYGIFDTQHEAARRKGADAVALLRRAPPTWVLIAGTTVILVGIVISPLPGPGFTCWGRSGWRSGQRVRVGAETDTQIRERTGPLRNATQRGERNAALDRDTGVPRILGRGGRHVHLVAGALGGAVVGGLDPVRSTCFCGRTWCCVQHACDLPTHPTTISVTAAVYLIVVRILGCGFMVR